MVEAQWLSVGNKLSRLIQQCCYLKELKQIHARIITSPTFPERSRDYFVSRLLYFTALSDSGCLNYATEIFSRLENPSRNFYNIMIRAYATKTTGDDHERSCRTFALYKRMLCDGIAPDFLTVPFVVKECAKRVDAGTGQGLHGQSIKFGVYYDLFVQNSLVSFYSACRLLGSAREVFDEMSERDVVSWNSMVVGYLRSGYLDEALGLFRKMKKKNVISWNSIITGFYQGGRPKEALELFREMEFFSRDIEAVRPDKITIASVLSACASIGAIDLGIWVHNYLDRNDIECDTVIGTALVEMYGKCGCVERAYEVFRQMPKKDTMAWTSIISVFALHGQGNMAFDVFDKMQAEGVKPNHVTFVVLLSACAHSGLVEKSRWCFDAMRRVYSIEPKVYHYACMVNILARAGLFEEAEELIGSMPMKPDEYVWGALLGGCQMHGNVELGKKVAEHIFDIEPSSHAYHMNLCDVYAKAFRFDDVKRTRILMKEKGLKKTVPGCSMI